MLTDWIRRGHPIALLLALLLVTGCGDDAPGGNQSNGNDAGVTDDAEVPDDGTVGPDVQVLPPTAVLEVYALDIWAQPLPEAESTLTITSGGALVGNGHPIATAGLYSAGDLDITLEAPEHETLQVSVSFNGSTDLTAVALTDVLPASGHGVSMSHEVRDIGPETLPIHTVYLGLRHNWFSAQGRPARRGNAIELLMDGEEAWSRVHGDLTAATDTVMVATWWWDSEFELLRDAANHHLLTPTQRWANTMLGVLEPSPAFHRVLIGEFWGSHSILDWLTSDADMEYWAETPNDAFEIMGQGNPTSGVFWFEVDPFNFADRVTQAHPEAAGRTFDTEADIASTVPARDVDLTDWPITLEVQIASYHQKFMVLDQEVAFVGGMNIKAADWDTSDHLIFDHRRMGYEATQGDREDVMAKDELPETGPRKDYMMRIEGPAVQDVADIFQQRWSYQIAQGADYSENSSDFVVDRDQPEQPGGSQIQITATLPEPFWEHAIAETWFNAVAQAEDYIFVEDQYWRIPMLVDAIITRMNQVPDLRLLVITKWVDDWSDPGCNWTAVTHHDLLAQFPNRYAAFFLRAFDYVRVNTLPWDENETESRYADPQIDVHSKMLIVDDKFLSVGSCNKNNRGIVYEGELNVAVLDSTWVREQRRRIFANMLPPGTTATDDVATWWTQFSNAASWNELVWENWDDMGYDIDTGDDSNPGPVPVEYLPDGFVYPFTVPEWRIVVPGDCLLDDVGPDMT